MSDDLTNYTAQAVRALVERVARLRVVTDVSNGETRAIVSLQSADPSVDVAEIQRRAASILVNERTHHPKEDTAPPQKTILMRVRLQMPDGAEVVAHLEVDTRLLAHALTPAIVEQIAQDMRRRQSVA